VEAPSAGSVILAGVLLKLGSYGLLRVVLPFFKEAVFFLFPFFVSLSLISILYPSFVALRQNDLKRIVAYSSISHMNLLILGVFSFNLEGLCGSYFLMLSHGFVSGMLFFLIGFLYDRYGSRLLFYYGGLVKVMPGFSFYFFLACLCNIGLPGTCNFIGELLIFLGLISLNKFVFFSALTTIILSALYTFFLFNRLCFGNLTSYLLVFEDITYIEMFILLPLCFLVIFLGLFPFFILDTTTSTFFLIIERLKY